MKILAIIFLFFTSMNLMAYVISKTEGGHNVKWNNNNKNINLIIDSNPTDTDFVLDTTLSNIANSGFTKKEYISFRTSQIIQESIDEWNGISPYQIVPLFTSSPPSVSGPENSFRYTSDYNYFGSGVIAITSLVYSASNGNIFSADVLINQSFNNLINLSLDKSVSSKENAYIGDVITHELGHFLGLSHSEVINSAMVYSIFKGQHHIHEDDIAGLRKNYSVATTSGALKGKVIAGVEAIPIFGSNVQIISTKTNDVVQAQLTDENGDFFVENLNLDESYYIMVSPIKNKSSISDYYKNINNQLCFQKDFRSTFYTKCGPREKSRPQVFKLDSSRDYINVGELTIRCDENINTDYFANKFKSTDREFELLQNYHDKNVNFYGYFSNDEIQSGLTGLGDEFTLDLTNLDTGSLDIGTLLVNIDLAAVGIGSAFDFQVYTKTISSLTWTEHKASLDSTGKKVTDLNIRLDLSSDPSDNLFEIKIFPIKLSTIEEYEIFASPALLTNENSLYTITSSVGYYIGTTFYSINHADSYPYDDNLACTEGSVTYSATSYISESGAAGDDAAQPDQLENLGISCGTIDIDNDSNSGGFGSFMVGLFLMLLLLNKQNIRRIPLSKS